MVDHELNDKETTFPCPLCGVGLRTMFRKDGEKLNGRHRSMYYCANDYCEGVSVTDLQLKEMVLIP